MVPKSRVLIFIVAYNAEKTVEAVVRRIPATLLERYEVDVLIIDDASSDRTFEHGCRISQSSGRDVPGTPFPIRVLVNPENQGYGGNQKLGYHYAIKYGYDFVALVHGDGQYAPECLADLLAPLQAGEADAVFGSRLMPPSSALRGGMPLYKYAGNRILTWIENRLVGANLSEYHSGYRIYATRALASLPFDRNSNDFHFDTEIIIQLTVAGLRIVELPIPTYYGDEICYVNGFKYAFNVVSASLKARLQRLGLFYDRKFDCAPEGESPYTPKFDYRSPHRLALDLVRAGSNVLDLGCAGGYMAEVLRDEKQCSVTGVDSFPVPEATRSKMDGFYRHDLNDGPPALDLSRFDFVLMLDVIEHLARPEQFLDKLREGMAANGNAELILSTGNVSFFITRLMLLSGQFNYGRRGILDLTHTRLFTFASIRRALEQSGFRITAIEGIPGPFPLAMGDNFLSRALLRVNTLLIALGRGLFSYQIVIRAHAQPVLETLLARADQHAETRKSLLRLSGAAERPVEAAAAELAEAVRR